MSTRVIGYARLSDASREESTSVAKQTDVIRKYAHARDLTLVDIVVDEGVSASKRRLDDRPGLVEVRRRLARGEADAVVVWRLDRLARSVADVSTLLDEGVRPISATEPFDAASSMGRAMIEVSQVFAGLEARTIAERVASSIRYRRENGRYAGGNLPYGYRPAPNPDGEGRVLVIDPDEARVVEEVADRLLSGESLYAVAQSLNGRGVPTRRGGEWTIQALRRLVTGDPILGRVVHKGDVVRGDDGLPVTVWPPVLPLDVVERLRALYPPNGTTATRVPRRRAARLLSGVLLCSSCSAPLRVKTNGSGARAYACASRSSGRTCAAPVNVAADLIDEHVEADFLGGVGWMPETRIEERASEAAGLAEVEEAIRSTTDSMRSPGADIAALAARLADLHARREALAASGSAVVAEVIQTGRTLAEAWRAEDIDGRRRLLSSALDGILVKPGTRGRRGLDHQRLVWLWRS